VTKEESLNRVEIVNPAAGHIALPASAGAVERIRGLAGRQVILFSNNKPNVDIFYDELCRILLASSAVAGVSRVTKLSSAFPAAPEDVAQTTAAQLAINGMGD
jgi:hypothetical protein